MGRNAIKSLLAIGDYIVMVAALSLTLLLRYGTEGYQLRLAQHAVPFAIVFLVWIVVFYVMEMYNLNAPFNHRYFLTAMIANTAVGAVGFYLFLDFIDITPRRNLVLVVLVFMALFYGWRFLFNRSVDSIGWHRALVIIGSDQHSLELARRVREESRQGFRVAAILRDRDHTLPDWVAEEGIPVYDSIGELRDLINRRQIHTVVVSDTWYYSIYEELYRLIPYRLYFFRLASFWETFDESIPIYATQETWFLENFNRGINKSYFAIKRMIDILFVLVFSPIFLVLSLFTALLVRLSSKGPAVFSQTRIGQNERHFTIYKFRSMYIDAEKHGAQWAQKNDPRITPVGRLIRATRLDEIPQVINVLRGDMSLIGPRPERPEFVDSLSREIPHYQLRHLVKPGLTGWAQVKYEYGSSVEDAAIKLTYDLYYVKNVSLVLDIKITLKTILTVFGRRGR